MEAIELYHAERVPEPDLVASYRRERRRHQVIDPEDLAPGIRWRGYRPTRSIGWIRGSTSAGGESVFVPHVSVDLNWSRPHPDSGLLFVTTSGLAAGNHRLETLCHGVFEVVERDCEWRWDQLSPAAQRAREVNGDTADSPLLRRLLDQFASAGMLARMWDMTSAIGIPAYRCPLSDPRALGGLDPVYGAGCHLSKEVAFARALTEAAQCRLTFLREHCARLGEAVPTNVEEYARSLDFPDGEADLRTALGPPRGRAEDLAAGRRPRSTAPPEPRRAWSHVATLRPWNQTVGGTASGRRLRGSD